MSDASSPTPIDKSNHSSGDNGPTGRGLFRNPVIAALDLPERAAVLNLAKSLSGEVGMLKLGLEAFVGFGPKLVEEVVGLGSEVFLDLKVHDIPRTVEAAAAQARSLGVRYLTIHASGGADMISAAVAGAGGEVDIIAVTVLTSLDAGDLAEVGFSQGPADLAKRLGEAAIKNGAHGLVCSALELDALKSVGGIRVVPGVRPEGLARGDQKRVVTPGMAMAMGATQIVVGRPIYKAADPQAAARDIVSQCHRSSD